ncbi:hypothetical protein [Caldimonas brevitalea]|uniref:RNA-binding protein n=1 Tax=Caldimonas brevitalea TaxID=413882 RepID=A0A0G3BPQ2_9BURK|nr:hypothetical protein [Caldimonas brevitalea]AKJ29321.1 hypothetical protein AAW51_2630 [Caldimonas brevitalea]
MTRLLLGNLESGTTDDEIRGLLARYGFPPIDNIEHLGGDGGTEAAVLKFQGVNPDVLYRLRTRIHEMHWKHRKITAQILTNNYYG